MERADFNKVFNLSFGELLPKLSSSETLGAGAGEVTGRFALVTYSCDRDFYARTAGVGTGCLKLKDCERWIGWSSKKLFPKARQRLCALCDF